MIVFTVCDSIAIRVNLQCVFYSIIATKKKRISGFTGDSSMGCGSSSKPKLMYGTIISVWKCVIFSKCKMLSNYRTTFTTRAYQRSFFFLHRPPLVTTITASRNCLESLERLDCCDTTITDDCRHALFECETKRTATEIRRENHKDGERR